ncbi:MAG: hypothetical protein A2W91_07610 [Bacteroidetes bacterium GWF2_38_335]|nr:MAG: hypothetical protein A2W91_07610 [Bacteroidetes bacterium GWF2_38_335]OFY79074.1 MAG: hypothetical protein A2281_03110 [Bacteroidetes bacterium RIFOXYA12_FULL_38_20]HBS86160.1 hypothetical protein [Bacteroidales bacterium]
MKNQFKKITLLATSLVIMAISSCKECKNEDPRARIINEGTDVASVQIKTTGGNTENINNIEPGTASEFRSYAPGMIKFTVSIDTSDYVIEVEMSECFEYDIKIDENNNLTSVPTDRNEK